MSLSFAEILYFSVSGRLKKIDWENTTQPRSCLGLICPSFVCNTTSHEAYLHTDLSEPLVFSLGAEY